MIFFLIQNVCDQVKFSSKTYTVLVIHFFGAPKTSLRLRDKKSLKIKVIVFTYTKGSDICAHVLLIINSMIQEHEC